MKFLKILPLLFLIFSCTPTNDPLRNIFGSYRNYINVNGKIIDGIYYEPYKRFSIKVPNLVSPGYVIRGGFDKISGTITFTDDFGKLVRVDVMSDKNSINSKLSDSWLIILSFNRNFFLDLYKKSIRDSKITHQEYIDWKEFKLDFFVTKMIAGSIYSDGRGVRKDALRGSIAIIHEKNIITISAQKDFTDIFNNKKTEEDLIKDLKKELLTLLETLKFTQ